MSDYQLQKIVEGLNPGQVSAATAPDVPIITVAGAGCGKTKTSVHRIAFYIHSGVEPDKILAMTFSNKAAKETRDRVKAFIPDAQGISSCTYHSFALREIIQEFSSHEFFKRLGYTRRINIIDDKDSNALIREARKLIEGFPDLKNIISIKDSKVKSTISLQRSKGFRASNYMRELASEAVTLGDGSTVTLPALWKNIETLLTKASKKGGEDPASIQAIQKAFEKYPILFKVYTAKLWRAYEKECVKNNGIDFDDVLILSCRLLQNEPDVLKSVADKFSHFVLDEFQDVNKVQFDMLMAMFNYREQITNAPPNIFVVADTRQAIYSFRGSDSKYVKYLKDKYSSAELQTLDTNYRSNQLILNAANSHAKTMNNHLTNGELLSGIDSEQTKPEFVIFENYIDEAKHIVSEISQKIQHGINASDIAILYRTAGVKTAIEQELASASVPFHVVGDASFFDAKEVADTIAFLRALSRPYDHLATSRIVDTLSGVTGFWYRSNVGDHSNKDYFYQIAGLSNVRAEKFRPMAELFNAVYRIRSTLSLREAVIKYVRCNAGKDHEVSDDSIIFTVETHMKKNELDNELLEQLRGSVSESHATLRTAFNNYYVPRLTNFVKSSKDSELNEQESTELAKRLANLKTLFDDILSRLSEDLNLDFDTCVDDLILASETSPKEESSVQVLTLHKSKGLEFKHVYAPSIDDAIFFRDESPTPARIEDESNLFYVGLTRAMDSLVLTSSSIKQINGETKANYEPLRFLTPELLENFNVVDKRTAQQNDESQHYDESPAHEQNEPQRQMSMEDIANHFNI